MRGGKMKQVTLCVPLEVKPESCSRLTALIEDLKQTEDKSVDPTKPNFWRFQEQIPTLHFLSISVFPAHDYDPLLIVEANFDGSDGPFWAQLEALIGDTLRSMIRCCKRPGDGTALLYDSVTEADSRTSVAAYLEARTQRPSVFHHGNRGLTCQQIRQERALFLDMVAELDRPGKSAYRGVAPAQAHGTLRATLSGQHSWLNDRAPTRFSLLERIGDWLRFLLFVAAVLAVLAVPGLLIIALNIVESRSGLVVALVLIGSIVASVGLILFWVRYLEKRDSAHDRPRTNENTLREMVRREDWITQNHMGSIVLIKPGVLRMIIIRAGHFALHLLLRAKARDGYLGSMRTVHFAHWAFLNNKSRLLFFSNFDHSWDSYLDDFIEKAHAGLTLAWGCGVGFPETRFLIQDGASRGRQFKAWALASRTVSRFWYSAYPDLTVDQVERNHRIATGLRKATLNHKEAVSWMQDL